MFFSLPMIDRTTLRNCKYRACLFIIRSESTQLQPFLHRFSRRDFSFALMQLLLAFYVFVVVVVVSAATVLKSFYHSFSSSALSIRKIYIQLRSRRKKTVLLLKLIYIYLCYPPFAPTSIFKTKINALLNCLYILYTCVRTSISIHIINIYKIYCILFRRLEMK